jgi:fructuronate reductase
MPGRRAQPTLRAMNRLDPTTLQHLPRTVLRPTFDRSRLEPGIVHLGIGAFARAHLLPITDAALAATGDPRWGVVGVSLRQADTRDALQPQDGLYTLALRDAVGTTLQVVGSLLQVLVAPEDPQTVLRRLAAPATRIVSLTITEKGYCHDPASGLLRLDHPDIVQDLSAGAPRSAPGYLVRALQARRAIGLGGLTVLSCDNLPANGHTLRGVLLALAEQVEPGLAAWVDAHCSFPNTMVDRIVPRTTDADRAAVANGLGFDDAWPVVAEPFMDWAIEDRFVAGRPDWSAGGARFVDAAEPYERLKLRLVNGSHSALAYLGSLAGLQTVHDAATQPALRGYIEALMEDEVMPTLPAMNGVDLPAYGRRLLLRFANPALQHRLLQIAMDGSQKLPQRWLATVQDRLAAGQPFERLALAVAGWLLFVRGLDAQGRALPLEDPLADTLRQRADTVGSFLGLEAVFGTLAHDQMFAAAVQRQLRQLQTLGAVGAAAALQAAALHVAG